MLSDKPHLIGLVALCAVFANGDKLVTTNKTENVWRAAGRLTGSLIQNCMQLSLDEPREQFLFVLKQCLKRRSLVALDNALKADVIKLANGVELVRYTEYKIQFNRQITFSESTFKNNETDSDWQNQIIQRIAHVLNTHVLKIRLNSYEELKSIISVEGRGRRKHNMFGSLLMFGIAAVTLIMVPLGFQFLAVLGGKALLLAKLALILTAIQGLKKIATSNINYGLYSTSPEHHGPCKDESCNINYNLKADGKDYTPLEADDSTIFVAVDVDELWPQVNSHDVNFWHYDRQWPYEAETHDIAASHNHYYQVPERHSDLLHPLYPRVDTFQNIM